ncbi:MarR family winged helix-turn-helix transcriptional regulator [Nonomuraea zeae]|uniref:MarR family transcriptional regulator n=1 Tax=Nonomuraea zeae TaxID=1642303 RepID=A0A5S4G9M5_9ACTN|nr:MarR family transcriptional regulator [Nonomuraea zeae]TMR29707.1 MarR family transcriptional regulator [Nonomuraea zeae]
MTSVTDGGGRQRRRLTNAVKEELRDLNIQLSQLNRRVGASVNLKDVDWDCLDLINRTGPLTPSALAAEAGLHPATLTGILDRLQRAGWITRERTPDAADRRAVTVRANRDRNAELFKLFAPMNERMDVLCADYSEAELELLAGFLRRIVGAGREATKELAGE